MVPDTNCSLRYCWGAFKHAGFKTFDVSFEINFQFSLTHYSVDLVLFDVNSGIRVLERMAQKFLPQNLSSSEVEKISEMVQKSLLDEIEYRIKELDIL